MKTRPRLLLAITAVVAALGLTACSSGSAGTTVDSTTLKSALPTSVPAGTTITIADQSSSLKTLFEASGVEKTLGFTITWQEVLGQPLVLQALRAGADLASASEVGAVFAQSQGVPVKVISALKNNTSYPYLFASADPSVSDVAQLKGKKIAWVQGTSYSLYTIRVLKSAGLTVKDVKLVPLTFATIPNAVATHQVDAGALVQPQATTYLGQYGAKGLHELSAGKGLTTGLGSTLYATQKALSDPAKAAALGKIVAAYVKAWQWVNANPDAWADAYYVKVQKVAPASAAIILDKLGKLSVPTLASLVPSYSEFIDELDSAQQLTGPVDAKNLIDTRFDPIEQAAVGQ